MSAGIQSGQNALSEALDRISSRLTGVGFAVERSVSVQPYVFNILAHRVVTGYNQRGFSGPWSNVVGVISINDPSPNDVANYSTWVMKFAVSNRGVLKVRMNGLATFAIIICRQVSEATRQWLNQLLPSRSMMWDRAEFPVIISLDSGEISYSPRAESGFGTGDLYKILRNDADEWFGSTPVDEN